MYVSVKPGILFFYQIYNTFPTNSFQLHLNFHLNKLVRKVRRLRICRVELCMDRIKFLIQQSPGIALY